MDEIYEIIMKIKNFLCDKAVSDYLVILSQQVFLYSGNVFIYLISVTYTLPSRVSLVDRSLLPLVLTRSISIMIFCSIIQLTRLTDSL